MKALILIPLLITGCSAYRPDPIDACSPNPVAFYAYDNSAGKTSRQIGMIGCQPSPQLVLPK